MSLLGFDALGRLAPFVAAWMAAAWPGVEKSASGSRRFRRPLKLPHVIVQNGLLTTTIPLDRYSGPIRFRDGALVGIVLLPADFVVGF
jgi:hypothetical protein